MQLELDLRPPQPSADILVFPVQRMRGAIRETIDDALASPRPRSVIAKEVSLWRRRLRSLDIAPVVAERSIARFRTELQCEMLRRTRPTRKGAA